ncbi:predicted protein [Naegleria gruberi]|uniref:Predicted protein n=1 Tax=Naegleria gruberi TaxID=5762 RepID=D2VUM1_NAEGR|nr:uncharacterized protein NAEGRDRAFT_72712 [Naegleria gruberi]EFC39533.1 predicted protein [Naegleria gruberi]|eukprot:XP_002672277.1 predicted protein [Naegleria gruberi strain NEG-M]
MPATVYGSQYLIDKILSILVPTKKEFSLSPRHFIPVWCFLIGLLVHKFDEDSPYFLSKEYYKYYPNLYSNTLAMNFLRKFHLKQNVLTRVDGIIEKFHKDDSDDTESSRLLLKSITSNEPFLANNQSAPINIYYRLITMLKKRINELRFIVQKFREPTVVLDSKKELEPSSLQENVEYLQHCYQLLKNVGELMDMYMDYKYQNRKYQSLGTIK